MSLQSALTEKPEKEKKNTTDSTLGRTKWNKIQIVKHVKLKTRNFSIAKLIEQTQIDANILIKSSIKVIAQ